MRLDGKAGRKLTTTEIKCIGDCYIAAGGIFNLKKPEENAEEVVTFGMEAIRAMDELNAVRNESLEIHVGVNTGADCRGVLGIGKPTFEILGPAINMAQQMEHHGVPGQVHISRPVYELIYGGEFKVAERGTVEVKSGSVTTYLVTGRNAGNAAVHERRPSHTD
jgi:class 3 adenylate cyclase